MCKKSGISYTLYPPYLVHVFIEQPQHKKRSIFENLLSYLEFIQVSLHESMTVIFFLFDPAICSACRVSNLMILFRIIRCFCFVYSFFQSSYFNIIIICMIECPIELVSKELNHLAAILYVYARGLNFMK